MNDKEFLIKYENLLNKGYCDCNEMNCIDNNSPRRILNIAIKQQKEIERLNNIINGIEAYCNMAITMNFNMNNSKLKEQIVEDYTNVLDKLKELKDSD